MLYVYVLHIHITCMNKEYVYIYIIHNKELNLAIYDNTGRPREYYIRYEISQRRTNAT